MKARLFASAALVLLNAIPGALSAEPQLRGVILATDFEDQLDLYDSKDEDLSEDFDFEATEPFEEDEFDSSEDYKMEPYEEDFYGRGKRGGGGGGGSGGGYHHQGMPRGMSGGMPGNGGVKQYNTPYYNGGRNRAKRARGKKGAVCKSGRKSYAPQDSVCYCLSPTACEENAYEGCQWNRAGGGYCDGGY
eukprot:scaffold2713_cov78-Skeletonema_dohrnii-CCMP3373.AAC.1